ncbi:MAG: type IX secretion system sortase PorU [Paludibacteraceae bacterium]|nr:type IX secretion system sortase PorU [Paludibacteraceae bacterium]
MRLKFILFFWLLGVLSSMASIHSYSDNSVLSKGSWTKIRVSSTGVCKITYTELYDMGFSNPSKVRVFGYGGAILNEDFSKPKVDDLPELSIYDGGSFILFYAQGPIKWNYNENALNCRFGFEANPYSNYGYYFLTDNVGVGKRIAKEEVETSDAAERVTDYVYYDLKRKEEMNFVNSGRQWYGDMIYNGQSKTYSFFVPNINMTKNASVDVTYAGSSNKSTKMDVSCGGETANIGFSYKSLHLKATEGTASISFTPTSTVVPVSVKYYGDKGTDIAALNRIVLNAYCNLAMVSGVGFLPFRNPDCIGTDKYSTFVVGNATSSAMIWNVTDPLNVTQVPTEKSENGLEFTKKTEQLQEFVAVNPTGSGFVTAEYVGKVVNQNLHTMKDADYVIITYPAFASQANVLALKHMQVDGVKAVVVTPEQVYNEFSSGTPDATAYRWFMKMIYDQDNSTSKYLLLFGDGSFDNKGLLGTKLSPSHNYILTFQSYSSLDETASYTTDDYFGFLEDNEGGPGTYGKATVDIGVGRLPVASAEQATGVVNKILNYMDEFRFGTWKNRVVLLGDDNESSTSQNKFYTLSDGIARIIASKNPAMEIKKIYLDAYTREVGSNGAHYPEVESLLQNEINKGIMYLNYIGHSSKVGWSGEHIFTQSQASTLYNENMGLWFTASCQFSQFDDLTSSGGEDLILNPNGGPVALYSSSRVVYDDKNDDLNRALVKVLFDRDDDGRPICVGDIYKKSKQHLPTDTNKLAFSLLADPMLRLSYPDLFVVTDSMSTLSGEPIDTMKALSKVRVFASIKDNEDNKITTFNGKVSVVVYDKVQTLYTKANLYNEEIDIISHRYSYEDRPNMLFSGNADVVNGELSFVIPLPKDINYSYGNGRISYYAYDETNKFEAQGAYEDFIIGGSDTLSFYEKDGPNVSIYLNSTAFKSGDDVNEKPMFLASVSDVSGINASGCGIGHDITLSIDDSPEVTVLNSYFSYESGSYMIGSLAYQMPELEEGHHVLTFKIWDLLNNSTTSRLEFNVVKGLKVNVNDMILYPNPARDHVSVRVTHDRPDTKISYRMTVYDLSGRLVYVSKTQSQVSSVDVTFEWDLRTNGGSRVDGGTYLCKVEIASEDGDFDSKVQNLIVLPQ